MADAYSYVLMGSKCGKKSSSSGVVVDWRLLRSWSRWPLAVGIRFLITVLKLMLSMPGHDWKYPNLIALKNVLMDGLSEDLCRYSPSLIFGLIFPDYHVHLLVG